MRRIAIGAPGLSVGIIALFAACNAGQPGQGGQEPAPSGALAIEDTDHDAGATRVADENELLSQAERLQSNLDAILASNSTVTGNWFVGDVTAEFTMYFDGERETYAEERVQLGDGGTAWRQYFFDDGVLVFFVEEGTRPSADSGRDGTDSVIVVLDFDGQGNVKSFYKTVGGAPADLGESEGALVLQSLERLRQGARQAGP